MKMLDKKFQYTLTSYLKMSINLAIDLLQKNKIPSFIKTRKNTTSRKLFIFSLLKKKLDFVFIDLSKYQLSDVPIKIKYINDYKDKAAKSSLADHIKLIDSNENLVVIFYNNFK